MTINAAVEGQQDQNDAVFDEMFDKAEQAIPVEDDLEKGKEEEKEEKEELQGGAAAIASDEGTAGTAAIDTKPDYEHQWKTLQGMFRHEKEEWLNEKEKMLAQLEAAKAQPKPDEKKEEDPTIKELLASLDLTDEQKAQLEEYDSEFDVVSKMEGLKRKSEMARLKLELHEMLQGFRKEFAAQQQPVKEFIDETQKEREEADVKAHFKTIADAHPDFTKYRDDGSIKSWIESKPTYLRKRLVEIYSAGTAEDIVEMLDDFKTESSIQNEDASRAKADKKKTLTPPVTRKGAVNASMSVASDFDGAFDEAINKIK